MAGLTNDDGEGAIGKFLRRLGGLSTCSFYRWNGNEEKGGVEGRRRGE